MRIRKRSHCPSNNEFVQLRAFICGKWEQRNYTPIRFDGGTCEIFFRVYPAPDGAMSRYLQLLQRDDRVEMMGPVGTDALKFQITPQGLAAFVGNRAHVISFTQLCLGADSFMLF